MYDHSRRTLMISSLAVLATFLDTTILFVAFPDITATFSGSPDVAASSGTTALRVPGARR